MTDVLGPDGIINRFPDSMSDSDIEKAMAAHYSAAQEPKALPRKDSPLDIASGALNAGTDWLTLGAKPNWDGTVHGAFAALQGKPFLPAFQEGKLQSEQRMADFDRNHPGAAVIAKGIGGSIPAIFTGGGSAGTMADVQVLRAAELAASKQTPWIMRRAGDAARGAAMGSIVGANQSVGVDKPKDALANVALNTAIGGVAAPVVGAGGEAIAPTLRATGNAVTGAFGRAFSSGAPTNAMGMGAGNMFTGASVPPASPRLPPQAKIDPEVVRLGARAGSNTVQQNFEDYNRAGMQPLLGQMLDEPGLQRMQTLSTLSGKTPTLAAKVIAERRNAAPGQLRAGVDEAFGTTPRDEAQTALSKQFDELSDGYRAVTDQASINPQAFEPILARLKASGDYDKALAIARRNAARLGRPYEQLSSARQMQELKIGMDELVGLAVKNESRELPSLTQVTGELRNALETSVPGYKDLNAKWADAAKAQDLLGADGQARGFAKDVLGGGKTALSNEALAKRFTGMSDQQKAHGLIAVAEELRAGIRERTKLGVRKTNIASPYLNEETGLKLEAILGDKADDLLHLLTMSDRDFDTLSSAIPRGGSKTAGVFGDMVDMATAEPPTKHGISKMLDTAAGELWGNVVRNPVMEARRNDLGAKLYSTVDEDEARRIVRAITTYESNQRAAEALGRRAASSAARTPRRRGLIGSQAP